ncbi:MAG: EAL domain-containing protein [Marinobacter sp.]|nr:EAL domain-containing protein [Marinobacter sp.]
MDIRNKAYDATDPQAQLHKNLLSVGAELASATTVELDRAIERALERVGHLLGADRSYVFRLTPDLQYLDNTFEWCALGVTEEKHFNRFVPASHFPWLMTRLPKDRVITIPDTRAMPKAAAFEQREFQRQKIQSLVMIPLRTERLLGFLGFDLVKRAHHWTPSELEDLVALADILADALQRIEATETLGEAQRRLFKIASQLPGIIYQYRLFPDGRSVMPFISDRVDTLFGIPPASLRDDAMPLINRLHPEDRERVLESIRISGLQEQSWAEEFRAFDRDDQLIWMEGKAEPELLTDGSILWHGYLNNIQRRKQAEEALQEHVEHTDTILDHIVDAIVTVDRNGVICRTNASAERIFGFGKGELVGQNVSVLMPDHIGKNHDGFIQNYLRTGETWVIGNKRELVGRHKDGGEFPIELEVSPITRNDQVMFVAMVRDITERKAHEREIEELAFYDPLTQLPNRRLLQDRLDRVSAASRRTRNHSALIFIDLDNFKTLNDSAGHSVGDDYLKSVARALQSCVRRGDTVARLGGDEFVILLANLSRTLDAAVLAVKRVGQKIRQSLQQPFIYATGSHVGSSSLGVTLFVGNGVSTDELFQQADIAMYEAKAAGKNTLMFFDPAMQRMLADKLALERDIKKASEAGSFQLHLQPQLDVQGRVSGAEALIRWPHPERGMVPPGLFIPVAEETGQIVEIGRWVLEKACQQLAAWARHPLTQGLTLAVNISPVQFARHDFVASVEQALSESGAQAKHLELELTEGMLVADMDLVIEKMQALKRMGVRFSLDDFGTGYSSLAYLKKLPLTQLKIDQSFVRDILTDPNDSAIARTIVALANSMGMDVIAEGVETEGHLQALERLGCYRYQGYLFSPPLPAAEFMVFLEQHAP